MGGHWAATGAATGRPLGGHWAAIARAVFSRSLCGRSLPSPAFLTPPLASPLYTGTAPIFVATSLQRVERLEALHAAAVQAGVSSEAGMMLRRLQIFRFIRKMEQPASQIRACPCCFAQWVFEGVASWS